jgi:nitroreductase
MRSALARTYRSIEAFLVDHAKNPFFRALAVLLTLLDLRREALSVVWGRHDSRRGESRAALTAVRRDIHRVEKGLVMRPRRVPFGKDYVPELVTKLQQLSQTGTLPQSEREWGDDVLRTYFEVTSEVTDEWVIAARRQYEALSTGDSAPRLVPAPRSSAKVSDVTFADLERLAVQRRSVRWFTDKPVDPSLVDEALLIAGQAPSACNRQNIRFHMVYGTAESAKILSTVGGTRGFGDQVPAVAVLIGRLAGYRYGFDRHAIYIDGGLASMGFLFGLETLGLSSCCINWPDVGSRYDAIKKLVPLAADEQILMLIAIGTADPDGLVPSSHKRSIETLRTSS